MEAVCMRGVEVLLCSNVCALVLKLAVLLSMQELAFLVC